MYPLRKWFGRKRMKILRFWGIPIHKIPSDTEFVEKTRKSFRHRKKYIWFHVVILIILSIFIPWLIGFVHQVIEFMPDGVQKWAWLGLFIGCAFGAFIGQYIALAGQAFLAAIDFFDVNRGTKLLIQYHDTLQEIGVLEQEQEQHDEQISPSEVNYRHSSDL
jgi:hypothetical protein